MIAPASAPPAAAKTGGPVPSAWRPRWHFAVVAAALVLLTLATFRNVGELGFVNLDDDAYVEHQPLVNRGWHPGAVAWAFGGVHSNNWHPLTTLSHLLDCEWFGLNPGPMHWHSLAWHTLNTLAVFWVWASLAGAVWRPALVAAIFAVHPLHVESVAWISERKDVLHAFFWLLGIAAYVRFVRRRSWVAYALVALSFVLALLAKPMAVTFPCTLLLLDFWPLRRWPAVSWTRLLLEKLPLFALAAAHSVVTFLVQSGSGAADFGERFTLAARLGNAVVAYARYTGKSLWPETLSPLYLHPGTWPVWALAGSLAFLAAVSAAAWRWRQRHPSVLFGWCWFLGTLVPVIGLVQVGAQSMADRYMYVPLLGLATALVWGLAALAPARPDLRRWSAAVALAVVAAFAVVSFRQVPAWRSSIALYERSIAAGEDNAAIRYLLGTALLAAGRPADAKQQFETSLARRSNYVNSMTQLAILAMGEGRTDDARKWIERSVAAEPENPQLRANLGAFWMRAGRNDEAEIHLAQALAKAPHSARLHEEFTFLRVRQGREADALHHLEQRARLLRWSAEAAFDYGAALVRANRAPEARPWLERSVYLRPDLSAASDLLARLPRS